MTEKYLILSNGASASLFENIKKIGINDSGQRAISKDCIDVA
jgi:hypothetical protein